MTTAEALRRGIRRARFAAAFAGVAGAFPVAAEADPSFDCARATERVEQMICEEPAFAKLDQQIADIYFALLESVPPVQANEIRQQQRDFLRHRNLCPAGAGLPADCLESSLWERLGELQRLQADLIGAPVVSGGSVIVAPGITWQASLADAIPGTAYRLDSGAILCAVGLPGQPTIGTAGSAGCRVARRGEAVEIPVFHTLVAGDAAYGWAHADSASAPPAGAVAVWRDGEDRVMVCRALIAGAPYIGTLTVGDACAVLFTPGEVGSAPGELGPMVEEVLVLAGFEVMTAPE